MKTVSFFALRVFALYVLLLLPWPGWSAAYNVWFRTIGTAAALGGGWIVRIEPIPADEKSPLSTRFIVGNPRMTDPQGNIPGMVLDLDAWGVGWVPTALVLSLIGATKLTARRRIAALGLGALLINLYAILCIRIFLWNGTADLMGTNGISQSVAGALNYTFVTQMGAGLTVAVLIWLAVTFRAGDEIVHFWPEKTSRAKFTRSAKR